MPRDLVSEVHTAVKLKSGLRDVERALAAGADPSEWEAPATPLRFATQAHHVRLVELLLKAGANVNLQDAKGVTVLHVAVFEGHPQIVKLLLDADADTNIKDRHGQTPLFFAPTRTICQLLMDRQADVNVVNTKKQSPLHLAAHAGLNDAVAFLVDTMSTTILDVKDQHGHTPLFYAAHSKVKSTVGLLQLKGVFQYALPPFNSEIP
ncbi:unnamed protein product, partial [Polarella glacialis]